MIKVNKDVVTFHGKDLHFFRPMTNNELSYSDDDWSKKIKYYYKQNKRYRNFNNK